MKTIRYLPVNGTHRNILQPAGHGCPRFLRLWLVVLLLLVVALIVAARAMCLAAPIVLPVVLGIMMIEPVLFPREKNRRLHTICREGPSPVGGSPEGRALSRSTSL